MESMNLLDITIKYFNVIVFVLCVVFGMISLFASWIAWREIHKNRNLTRSVVAAYNIAEETLEKGRTPLGELRLDPAVVETVLNSLQEILNAIYSEVTGKPIPAKEDRLHGPRRLRALSAATRVFKRKDHSDRLNIDCAVPPLIAEERERHHSVSP